MSSLADEADTPLLCDEDSVDPLSHGHAHSRSGADSTGIASWPIFLLATLVIFLAQAGLAVAIPSIAELLEDIICAHYYAEPLAEPRNRMDCKAEPVQTRLAMLRGVASVLLLLPCVVLTVPYTGLAQRWGVRPVLALSASGIFLEQAWVALVCWYGRTSWPVELVYLSPVFYLIGGGLGTASSLVFILVADVTPPHLRASRFYLLEASSFGGSIAGYTVSPLASQWSPWVPVQLGLVLLATANALIMLDLVSWPQQSDQEVPAAPESVGSPPAKSSTSFHFVGLAYAFFWRRKLVSIVLIGYFLRALAMSVMKLQILYVSHLLHWEFSQAAYILSLDSGVHLAVLLLLLPIISRMLQGRLKLPNTVSDAWIARGSSLLSLVGCLGTAVSSSPPAIAISTVLYSLGAGYYQSVRAMLTAVTESQDRAVLYSVMMIVEIIATLIGAFSWPMVYGAGLQAGGFWVGMPFVAAAAILAFVYSTLAIVPSKEVVSEDE